MFTKGYYVTAELKVKDPTKAEEAKFVLTKLCSETLKEKGCSIFELHQIEGDENRFLLWERFDDEQAFNRHFDLQHTKDYLASDYTEVVQFFKSSIVE